MNRGAMTCDDATVVQVELSKGKGKVPPTTGQ